MDDINLIKQALNGDKQAFETLIEKYQGMIYGFAYHRLGQFSDAQDVAQEVFLYAYQNLKDLRDHERFAGWLRGITNNLCKQHIRRKKTVFFSFLEDDEQILSSHASPEDHILHLDTRKSLHNLLQNLSDKNRQVLTLHYLNDLSDEAIAQMLDLSPGTVRVRLHRAKQQLKTEMIDMVKEAFEKNQLDPDFTDQVMKRIGVVGINIGDENGNVWLASKENERFVIRMPNKDAWTIANGPKISLKKRGRGNFVTNNLEDLTPKPVPPTHDFIKTILDEFGMNVTKILIDTKQDQVKASAIIKSPAESKTILLDTKDAIILAGKVQAPVYATARVFDQLTFGDGVDPLSKETALKEIELSSRKSVTWATLFKKAHDNQANRVKITQKNGGHHVTYSSDDQEIATEPIAVEDVLRLEDFGPDSDKKATWYAKIDDQRFSLNIKSTNVPKKDRPTLNLDIQPWE